MKQNEMKSAATRGMAWTGLERIVSQAMQFVIGIVIARMLSPDDYGVVGMLAVFMAVAQTFLDSGFANALIQRQDRTETDYATVFYFNLAAAVVLYALFYISAPFIAEFYSLPELTDVARVVSLALIINGLSIVQTAKLTIDLNFRLQSLVSIVAVAVSGVVGIVLAYNGLGVWSLVFQMLGAAFCRTVALWLFSHWRPIAAFSAQSFKRLFSFGSKLLCSSLINTIYNNVYTLVIGRCFAATEVGLFNRGNQFAQLPADTITQVVVKVNYPLLSECQRDNARLVDTYRRLLRTPMTLLFPAMLGLAAVAEPLIDVLLGAQWTACVPILQILCLGYVWAPLTHINLNLLYVKGRSDLVLRLEVIKKPIAFAILFVSIPFGLMWMCAGRAIYNFVAFSINCYYTRKLLGYGLWAQLREVMPIAANSLVMSAVAIFAMSQFDTSIVKLAVGVGAGAVTYIILSLVTKQKIFNFF